MDTELTQKQHDHALMASIEVHYVLENGTEFTQDDKGQYEQQKHRFGWVDSNEVNKLTRRLTGSTQLNHKSVILISEDGSIKFNIDLPLN